MLTFLALGQSALAQPELEKVREALTALREYSFRVIAATPTRRTATLLHGRLPNRLHAMVSRTGGDGRLDTVIYDGTWQTWALLSGSADSLQSFHARVSQGIAPPERPFDTFVYLPDSGLFAGEDYTGTFLAILDIFTFQESAQQDFKGIPGSVYDGTVSPDKARRLSQRWNLRGVEELLPGLLDSKTRLRLAVDSRTNLPVGYALGPTLASPSLVVTFQRQAEGLALPDSLFATAPRLDTVTGQSSLVDITPYVRSCRDAAQKMPLGSAEWVRICSWIGQAATMPADLSYAISSRDDAGALSLLAGQPGLWRSRDARGQTPLHRFAYYGSLAGVSQGVRAGAEVEAINFWLQTPLHLAVKGGQPAVVQALLEARANPSAADGEGNTPLHLAVRRDLADLLLAAGADARAVNLEGKTPLHSPPAASSEPSLTPEGQMIKAIKSGDAVTIERLLSNGFQPERIIDTGEGYSDTPLRLAAATSSASLKPLLASWSSPTPEALRELANHAFDAEVLYLLVARGADLDAPGPHGESLLFTARSARAQLALLEVGLDPSRRGPHGETLFQHLFLSRGEERDEGFLRPAMQIALDHADPGELGRPFPSGVGNDNLPGATAMHLAAEAGQLRWVEWLLKIKAPVDLRSSQGWTPLHLAAVGGYDAIVKRLRESGASCDTPESHYGRTPLHSASFMGHPKTVRLLLELGASPEALDKAGNSPLHLAAERGQSEVVKVLLASGASPRLRNRAGQSPADLLDDDAPVELKVMLQGLPARILE